MASSTPMDAVFEAKHVGAFFRPEEVLARYMPQLQHNMAVKGCELSLLSVIYGNHKWEVYEVAADWLYQDELLAAEQAFWDCVQIGRDPGCRCHRRHRPGPTRPASSALRAITSGQPPRPTGWRPGGGQDAMSIAGASIKDLIEADVARAFGHGIEAKRSKSGAITIKELAQ